MADVEPTIEVDEIEDIDQDVSIIDVSIDADMEMSEEEAWAYKIIKRAATLKGVTIKRDTFLRTELAKFCPPDVVDAAVATNPQAAGVSMGVMDNLADAAISIETRKVAGLSALAGLPGGLAMFGTIPADLVQYFAHSLRIEQKLAYIYGWESFLNDDDEVDDETMYRLILFLGIMLQVGGVGSSLTKFAAQTAKVGVAKTIEKQALTKTVWYNPLKQILRVIGVKVTKGSFAEAVSKGVPLIGGVVSGGLTYVTFKPGAISLKKYLRTLPQATGVILPEEEMEALAEQIEEESKVDYVAALRSAWDTAGGQAGQLVSQAGTMAEGVMGKVGDVAAAARDTYGDRVADHARSAKTMADGAARTASTGIKRGLGMLSSRLPTKRRGGGLSDVESQLRSLKSLLDDGIITQEDFDAKKKELLGL